MPRIFKRKIYERLLKWKSKNGKTAILIEGARRIGKTTLVEQFASNEYESHLIIDFNKASKQVKDLFNDIMDLDFLFLNLQNLYKVELKVRKSVIVFDEVQLCPMARRAIKHLVADGRYDYIETGSLISIKRNVGDIIIPSEEEKVAMHPMDFEEFCWALGDSVTTKLLRTYYEKKIPLEAIHRAKMRDLRLYMLVGGMPQAVNEYLDTNNLGMVDEVKQNIISLYIDDFYKIDPSGRMSRLYISIPAQLSQGKLSYKTSSILGNVGEERKLQFINELEDSKTVLLSHHCNEPNVGMSLSISLSKFKIYCSDTGLFVTLAFWDKDYTENIIYNKLLSDKLSANMGYVYENLVAQMLVASGNKLYYHTWQKDATHSYEIDFLLSRGFKLQPVEVKSSGYSTHASLDAFCKKYAHLVDKSYLIYTKDFKKDRDTILLPAYMTPFL